MGMRVSVQCVPMTLGRRIDRYRNEANVSEVTPRSAIRA